MISVRRSFLVLAVVLTSLVLCSYATNSTSEFTGSYSLGAASEAGDNVQLTISLTVANNTSADVSKATIALHDPNAARVTYGELTGVALPAGRQTQVNGSFTIPQKLYESWQKGSAPAMSVSYSNAHGNPVQMFIEF